MDFTIKKYKELLSSLIRLDYRFQTFTDYLERSREKVIILRHDVDDRKMNSLRFAQIQQDLGIIGTYYFRMVPQSYDPVVIKKIAEMGHEIGYHYEDLDFAVKLRNSKFKNPNSNSLKKNAEDFYDAALEIFKENLIKLRELYPVKTICMHGSPRSRFDNKSLWEKYNYKDFGIIGEPYFDIDFNKVLYLTDTGRRWDGDGVSIRDKVSLAKQVQSLSAKFRFHSTQEIVTAALKNQLPKQIMFTFHPQRWTDRPFPWMKELIWQNMKNRVKKYFIKKT